MDGLLIDSEPFWRQAEIKVFEKYGVQLTDADCIKTTGLSVTAVVNYWQNKFHISWAADKVAAEILTTVIELTKKQGKAMPGVYQVLDFFKNRDIKMAVASGSDTSLINEVLKKLDIGHYFAHAQSAALCQYGKPHPEVFITTARQLGVSPEQTLVFEDSINGVIAAKAARMKCVAVPEIHNQTKQEYAIADIKLNNLLAFDKNVWRQLTN